MKNAEKTITLYNYTQDVATGYDMAHRTVIAGVSAFCQTKVTVGDEGLMSADMFTLRIPEDAPGAAYVTPKKFAALADKTGYFTLAKGDKIVRGSVPDENPRRGDLESKYDNVITITGVTDNRGKAAPHWKVVGE